MGYTALSNAKNVAKVIKSLPQDLGGTVREFRQMCNITQGILAERALISINTVSRIERGTVTLPEIGTVIALCVALKLEYPYSMNVLAKSGYSGFFLIKNALSYMYMEILLFEGKYSVREVNDMLVKEGFKPLINEKFN